MRRKWEAPDEAAWLFPGDVLWVQLREAGILAYHGYSLALGPGWNNVGVWR